MIQRSTVREAITNPTRRNIIFGYELLSQPDDTLEHRIPGIRKRNDVVLANSLDGDIVLLTEKPDKGYHQWLMDLGLSTEHVCVLEGGERKRIPEGVHEKELSDLLSKFPKERVYVPRYSGSSEIKATEQLGIPLLGCSEKITMQFYDKSLFKQLCKENGIPTIDGPIVNISEYQHNSLKEIILPQIRLTGEAIIKDLTGSAGAGIYNASTKNVDKVIQYLFKNHPTDSFIIEPKLKIVYEPNDQWVIGLDDRIHHLGTSDQIIKNNAHCGNSYPSQCSDVNYVNNISKKVAEIMCQAGYKGVFGLDYLEDTQGNIFISENNARMNGSTPAWDIVNKFEQRHGRVESFNLYQIRKGKPMNFQELARKTESFLYCGESQYCFFPLDIGLINETGAITILTTGKNYQEAVNLKDEVIIQISN